MNISASGSRVPAGSRQIGHGLMGNGQVGQQPVGSGQTVDRPGDHNHFEPMDHDFSTHGFTFIN
jgi:hypothetical protein